MGRKVISGVWIGIALATLALAEGPVLRVGTSGDYPPFSRAGEGFEVEVAKRLARDLGMRIEWVPFRWPELERRLRAGDFDVVMSGVTWRPERDATGWMSRAVAVGGPCVVGDPSPARVAVNRGGVLERWARDAFPAPSVRAVDDNLSMPRLLAAREVEAFVTDSFEAAHLARAGWKIRCEPPRDRKVYWVSPQRAETLGPRIDAWLAAHEEEIAELRERWLGGAGRRDAAAHVTDLVARRLDWMPLVAAAKRRDGRSTTDPAREAAVFRAVRERAAAEGLDPDTVEVLWRELVEAAKTVQRREAAPGTGLDLENDIRPALSRLDTRLVAALAEVAPFTAGPGELEPLGARLDAAGIESVRLALARVRPAPAGFFPSRDAEIAGGLRLLGDDDHFLKLGAGAFDVAQISGERVNAGTRFGAQAELRLGKKILWVGPVAGVLANHDGGVYGYAGGHFDFAWGRWRGGPLLSLGAYEEGDGKDLGGVFQFHVGASLSVQLAGGSRVGFTFAHLSNAFIHDENPGTEFLLLHWMLPLRWGSGS